MRQPQGIIFLGPPGCGKGTQSHLLQEKYGIKHLSTGDLLREAAVSNTEFGQNIRDTMSRGALVNDDCVLTLLQNHIISCKHEKQSFILDGFPRNVAQAQMLERLLEKLDCSLDKVVYFSIPKQVLMERICGRRVHLPSGRIYHIVFNKPRKAGVDDVTGEPLHQRKDDNEEVFNTRLSVYFKETEDLIAYYKKQNRLVEVDANKSPSEVADAVLSALGLQNSQKN